MAFGSIGSGLILIFVSFVRCKSFIFSMEQTMHCLLLFGFQNEHNSQIQYLFKYLKYFASAFAVFLFFFLWTTIPIILPFSFGFISGFGLDKVSKLTRKSNPHSAQNLNSDSFENPHRHSMR